MPRSRSWSFESMMRPCWPPTSLSSSSDRNWPGLAEHLIDESRLAVVNVGDDGDVPNVVPLHGWVRSDLGLVESSAFL